VVCHTARNRVEYTGSVDTTTDKVHDMDHKDVRIP